VRRARAGWAPRELPEYVQRSVWKRLPGLIRLTMRGAPVGVALYSPEHGEVRTGRAKRDGVAVTVTGAPVELALFAFGRQAVAQVDYDGAPEHIEALEKARMGI
jgi:hypothetical protein